MEIKPAYRIPLAVGLSLLIGMASATIAFKVAAPQLTNIFDTTRNDCPNLTWRGGDDTLQGVAPITVEGELYFAGERVPLEDPDVRERLERELQLNAFWHSNTLMAMKLANRYFGDIEKALTENGVPADFKYLPLIESGFRNDVSPAGAVGFWQFVAATGRNHKLEINSEVDERYNIEKSTQAACQYLKGAKENLGNWTIAAASYNLGVPGMKNRIHDQKTNNFYEMYFNPETSRYIFRMLAMKIIFSNPKRAGFNVTAEDLYQPYRYKVVEVDTAIPNIADFAAQYGLRYKHIKILNTWLREAKLTNKEHKKYQIKIMEK
ncbi:MAG TPA: lytic transglycosylase domain-containing protein [Chitinophagales bacterium]|nr:lytic transglycosylase domain-containing protein [Chitinophagales bacterium]